MPRPRDQDQKLEEKFQIQLFFTSIEHKKAHKAFN